MLLIIIWYFFIIIFDIGLGLNLQKLASASRFWPRLTSLVYGCVWLQTLLLLLVGPIAYCYAVVTDNAEVRRSAITVLCYNLHGFQSSLFRNL